MWERIWMFNHFPASFRSSVSKQLKILLTATRWHLDTKFVSIYTILLISELSWTQVALHADCTYILVPGTCYDALMAWWIEAD